MYKIKTFKWIYSSNNYEKTYTVRTPFGSYSVLKIVDNKSRIPKWRWEYCFDEYYDEGSSEHIYSLKEAKEMCWKHWIEKLSNFLVETANYKK